MTPAPPLTLAPHVRRGLAPPPPAALNDSITKETHRYMRTSAKLAGQAALDGKHAALPESINALYAELDVLAGEKVALAERLVKLFERALARLKHDLARILKLQGDEPGLPPTQHFLNAVESTVQQLQTNIRAASAAAETPTAATPAAPPPQKSECRDLRASCACTRPPASRCAASPLCPRRNKKEGRKEG